jgi:hypothetical protein
MDAIIENLVARRHFWNTMYNKSGNSHMTFSCSFLFILKIGHKIYFSFLYNFHLKYFSHRLYKTELSFFRTTSHVFDNIFNVPTQNIHFELMSCNMAVPLPKGHTWKLFWYFGHCIQPQSLSNHNVSGTVSASSFSQTLYPEYLLQGT